MVKKIFISLWMAGTVSFSHATSYYISPTGNNTNKGTSKDFPKASLANVQHLVKPGDIVYILPGTYLVDKNEVMDKTSSTVWDIIYDFAVSGTEKDPIAYRGIVDSDGNRPVFDLSNVSTGKRLTGFYIHANYLQFSNLEVLGITVPKSSSNTQSENFRINGGSHCTFENIAAHDGMGIGFYLTGKSAYNVLTNCDAYNNFDSNNIEVNNGGNSDGFGCHVNTNCPGNKFIFCRAWQNSDDGFDFINCYSPATAKYCIAYRNGYDKEGNKRADGNGFKAGGYGMKKAINISEVPMHVVSHCLSVANKANGFYTNHHLGGVKMEYNSAYKNGKYNFSFVNRRGASINDAIDVNGYGHVIEHNLSYGTANIGTHIDTNSCTINGNSFIYVDESWSNENFSDGDFISLSAKQLIASRDPYGNLPSITFMQLKDDGKDYGYGSFKNSPQTSINNIKSTPTRQQTYYTLTGMPVKHPLSGNIYIKDGKKLIFLGK